MAVVVVAAFPLSSWPWALLIRAVFDHGGTRANQALAGRVPPGVVSLQAPRYDRSDADALFDLYRPQQALQDGTKLPLVVRVHGGGFARGKRRHVENYARMLAAQGYAVTTVGYSLAPARRYPTPVLQLNRALAHLQALVQLLQLEMQRVALAGDSAGAQWTLLATDPDYAQQLQVNPALDAAQLRAAVLFCGPYDGLAMADSADASWFLRTVECPYFGARAPDMDGVAEFSVARSVTARFPPIFISVGNDDPLQTRSCTMATALQRHSVPVQMLFFRGPCRTNSSST